MSPKGIEKRRFANANLRFLLFRYYVVQQGSLGKHKRFHSEAYNHLLVHMVAMGVESMNCCWRELLELLPPRLRESMAPEVQERAPREIRLRLGQMVQVVTQRGEWYPTCHRMGKGDLEYVLNIASRFSAYAAQSVAQGYITGRGGHRIGLCGESVVQNGVVTGLKELRSLCIRVARDIPGLADGLLPVLNDGSVLILGPPGSGKTTLLRDLIRQISDGRQEQIGVVDQRSELFPTTPDGFCFNTGGRTDVLTGAGKAAGIELLLRSMGPKWIALDEVSAIEDCVTLEQCGYCGVRFLATAHAWTPEDLKHRPVYCRLLKTGMFKTAIWLKDDQTYTVERL